MASLSPPASPEQIRSDGRPRATTSMSHASTRSHRSSRSRDERKLDLTESAWDKRRLEGKSDPTKALHEAQPAAVALQETTIEDINNVQHKDMEGNMIMDPDRSNPTRSRMERPLDTIRAFNAAAEGTISKRSSYQRQPSQNGPSVPSHRNSYYGSPNGRGPVHRPGPGPGFANGNGYGNGYGQGGYYNRNGSQGFRPDTYPEDGGPQYYPGPRQNNMRHYPTPQMQQQGESPNSMHSQQHYDAMTSGSDEMSKSTNPSSQNSSFDQLHQMRKPDGGDYNNNPYRQQPGGPVNSNGHGMRNQYPPSAMMNNGWTARASGPTDDYGMDVTNVARPAPMNLNGPVRDGSPPMTDGGRQKTTFEQPKRQSWIKRTFSKRQ